MTRANIRERLKTKSGCLTCRKRKKKCDETVPICGACHRNKWPCLWPGQVKVVLPSPRSGHEEYTSVSPTNVAIGAELVMGMRCPQKDASLTVPARLLLLKPDYLLRNYFFREGFGQLVRPNVHPGFAQDLQANTISIAAAYPCAMQLFLAFSALCISAKHPDVKPFALSHYSTAVSSTISRIQDANVNGSEDWLMTMACVMCVCERWYADFTYNPTVHIQAAAQMMFFRRSIRSPSQSQLGSPLQRICSESILYNTVVTSFIADYTTLLATRDFFKEFENELDTPPFPDASHGANSPLLWFCRKLFDLVLEISCLARQATPRLENRALLSTLQAKINLWLVDSGSKMAHERSYGGQLEIDCWKEARLYSLAADILLLKMGRPETRSNHPHVRHSIKQALDILQNDEQNHMYWIQQRCWPITIIGCSLSNDEEVRFLRVKMESSWKMTNFGDLKRTACILENIWKLVAVNRQLDRGLASRCSGMDGMDLLLRKDGLSVFLD